MHQHVYNSLTQILESSLKRNLIFHLGSKNSDNNLFISNNFPTVKIVTKKSGNFRRPKKNETRNKHVFMLLARGGWYCNLVCQSHIYLKERPALTMHGVGVLSFCLMFTHLNSWQPVNQQTKTWKHIQSETKLPPATFANTEKKKLS